MTLKSLSSALLACMLTVIILSNNTAAAQQSPTDIEAYFAPIQFQFDGKHMAPPSGQQGFIYKGSTYVPLRFIAYSLDKAVDWDGDTYTVTVREPNKSELVSINEYKMNRENRDVKVGKVDSSNLVPSSIPVYFETVRYVFDGKESNPSWDLPGMFYQDSLYVPMRFVSESVGKMIEWDPETYMIKAAAATKSEEDIEQEQKQKTAADPVMGGGPGPISGPVVKPTSDTLVSQAQSRLDSLKSSAQSTFSSLKNQYNNATTSEQKAAILLQGWNELSRINSSFETIVQDLDTALTINGYDTGVVQTIREEFDAMKSAEMSKLGL